MGRFTNRLQHAWNAFNGRDPTDVTPVRSEHTSVTRFMGYGGADRSIVTSIQNRIAMDVSAIDLFHVMTNENGMYTDRIRSGLDNCLTLDANIDQTGRALIQDLVLTMFEDGVAALVPIEYDINPINTESFDILSLRVGKIVDWYTDRVKVEVYNDKSGHREKIIVPKSRTAIIQNPLYAVMNAPNSTAKRLVNKLNVLDVIDAQTGSNRLDLIIQLPYGVRSDIQRKRANERLKDVENQLANSKYGIAYMDATEHITQLNRTINNTLMEQIEYLTSMLYSQLGVSKEVFDGTADEVAMLNYYNRTIERILSAITLECTRKFLSKNARTRGQRILFMTNPFKLVPISQIADIADKFTRNEILSSNEVRGIVGYKPSNDPKADELRNKNINQSNQESLYRMSDPYYLEEETDT